jgi:hypothetical protein
MVGKQATLVPGKVFVKVDHRPKAVTVNGDCWLWLDAALGGRGGKAAAALWNMLYAEAMAPDNSRGRAHCRWLSIM